MPNCSDELFPLSWLSQYGYCPRRCGLLAINQAWADNAETAAGTQQHSRVHTARIERRGNRMDLFDLPVFSRALGVNGKCDCVEAVQSPEGVPLPYGEGRFQLYPVEYKHGIVRDEEEYHIQLCAQAMCLEAMFGNRIPTGSIFYTDAHRRDEVQLTEQLRELTRKTAESVKTMIDLQTVPDPLYSAKCRKCSMLEVCQPKWKRSARGYCDDVWRETLQKEKP